MGQTRAAWDISSRKQENSQSPAAVGKVRRHCQWSEATPGAGPALESASTTTQHWSTQTTQQGDFTANKWYLTFALNTTLSPV